MTQPNQSTLARKWTCEVNTGTYAVPIWTTVKGISDFTADNLNPELKDDNVYEDGGWKGQTKTALSWQIKIKLMRRTVPTDVTSYDAGQEKLRALARLFGPSAVADVRWYDRDGGPEAFRGWANVTWSADGGSTEDLETVSVTLDGKGPNTIITNPNAPSLPVPIVTSVSPATVAAASTLGFVVTIKGDFFIGVSGAAAVKIGVTNMTGYTVVDRYTIVASLPSKTAATYDITVVNTTGTSATSAADQFIVT